MNDELLIKFLLKETSAGENAIVQDWLLASAENTAYFAQLEKIWKASGNLISTNEIDEELAWQKFKAKADALPTSQPIVKPLKRNYAWLKIAAVLVIAIGAWSVYTLFGPAAYTELASNNEVISKVLPDGSELTINKNTQISYAVNFKHNRNVRLQKGDVFFNVAHDQRNPFIIKIDKVNVEVVGTSFNIKHLKEETEIVVESGIVKVRLGNEEVKLVKGERILIGTTTKKLLKEQSKDQLYNYYRSKLFIANGTPISQLVEILNEAYGANIVMDETVKNKNERIYTTLRLGYLDENLENIGEVLKLKVSRNHQEIKLSYK